MRIIVCHFILIWTLFMGCSYALAAEEVAQGFTLDGRLYSDSAATTPLADIVSLKIQVLNQAQDCILYEETQSVNTTASAGYYTIQVGQKMGPPAGKRSSGDSNNSLARVFSNSTIAFNGKQLSDGTTACAYTPAAGHVRYLKITMTPSDGISRSTTTNMLIDSVPMALVAERAESLQGYTPANFIQVNNTTSALTQGNLESIFTTTGVSRLGTLLGVDPSSYVKTGSNGSATLPTVSGNPGSGLSAGQIWYDSAANQVKYYDGAVKVVGTSGTSFINGGNSFGGAATLGTDDNFALNFETNGSARLHIDNSGRVAIGTNSIAGASATSLTLVKPATTVVSPAVTIINSTHDVIGNYVGYGFQPGVSDAETATQSISAIRTGNYGRGDLVFLLRTSPGTWNSATLADEKMRITDAGDVGVATNSPEAKLDVNGAAAVKASYEGISTYVNSGAAYSIPDTSLNIRRITATANTTITLPAFTATTVKVFSLTVMIKQDATGSRTVSFAGNGADTIKWDSGAAPSISTTANKITILQFMKPSDEAVWYGSMVWREN